MGRGFCIAIINLMSIGMILAIKCQISVDTIESLNETITVIDEPEYTQTGNGDRKMTGMKYTANFTRGSGDTKHFEGGLCDKKKSDVEPMQRFIAKMLTKTSGLYNCWEWKEGWESEGIKPPVSTVVIQQYLSKNRTSKFISIMKYLTLAMFIAAVMMLFGGIMAQQIKDPKIGCEEDYDCVTIADCLLGPSKPKCKNEACGCDWKTTGFDKTPLKFHPAIDMDD